MVNTIGKNGNKWDYNGSIETVDSDSNKDVKKSYGDFTDLLVGIE